MPQSGPSLTMQEAADTLGVHYMTVYRYVRLGILPARKVGAGWRILSADLKGTSSSGPARTRPAPWRDRLQARMVAGDHTGSWKVAEAAMVSGMEPADFYCDVLTPALHLIGDRWQSGRLGVDDEHLASGVASGIIGRLGPRFARRGRSLGTVVTAMPAGERHFLGIAMLADILRLEGYRVLNLGADTPAPAVASAVGRVDDLLAVAVGVVSSDNLPNAASLTRTIRRSAGDIPVVAGGAAVPDADAAGLLGADGWAPDARMVGALIKRLTPAST